MAYSDEVLADSPLAYWRLGESSGTTIGDSSGNSRSGTYAGTYTLGVPGLLGGDSDTAVSATSGIGSIAAASWMNVSSALSLECFFKTSVSGTLGLIGRTNSGTFGTADTNTVRIYLNSGKLVFQVFNSSWNPAFTLQSAGTYNDGFRHHVVGTWDGSTAVLYVDGSSVTSTSASFTIASSATLPFYIGKMAGSFAYSGIMDEVAYYSSALSSTRVSSHYSAAGTAPTLAQVEANYLEVLASGVPSAQVEANYLEVLYSNPTAQVETVYLEALGYGTSSALVEAVYTEALISSPRLQAESVYAEVLASGNPQLQAESVYAEVLASGTPQLQAESVYVEVLVSNTIFDTAFRGWGVPIKVG